MLTQKKMPPIPNPQSPIPNPQSPDAPATILFIEDHAAVVEHPRLRLAQVFPQHRVVWARNGAEGLALARTDPPQVVVLDLALPDGDGFELIAPLRARARPPAIIIFTGRGDEATRVRALAAPGFAGLLWKGTDNGDQVVVAVGTALAGGSYISDYFARNRETGSTAPRAPGPRERIVVVKGNHLLADGIARAAREACPAREVEVCGSAAAAAIRLRGSPAWLGLIGLMLPDRDGLDFLAEALREGWFKRTLIVSVRTDERTRQALRTARIDGFFDCAHEDAARLAPAIRRVADGGTYFHTGGLAAEAGEKRVLTRMFSDTELLMLAVIGNGSDDACAAACMGMALATVRTHRQHIMRKLGVANRAELMREALRLGVVRFTETGETLTPGSEAALAERAASAAERVRKRAGEA